MFGSSLVLHAWGMLSTQSIHVNMRRIQRPACPYEQGTMEHFSPCGLLVFFPLNCREKRKKKKEEKKNLKALSLGRKKRREKWRRFNFRWCQATVPAAPAAAVTLNQTNNPATSNTETLDGSLLQSSVDTSKPGDSADVVFRSPANTCKSQWERGLGPPKRKVMGAEDGLKSEP